MAKAIRLMGNRFEFPDHTRIDELEIHWPAPSRQIDRFADLPVDRYIRIVEGRPAAGGHLA